MMRVRERYQQDPLFKAMVDSMRHLIYEGNTTPTEVREAAMLAQVMYEEEHLPRETFRYLPEDVDQIRRRR